MPSNYYASFVIGAADSPEAIELARIEQNQAKQRALAKLSAADKKILGIS